MTLKTAMLMATILLVMPRGTVADDWRAAKEYWDIVNDVDARAAERMAAEQALLSMTEPNMLYTIFRDMYRRPIGPYEGTDAITWLFSGGSLHVGGPVAAEQGGWPQHGFIIRSRMALWDHFTQNAEPREDRIRILLELFDEYESTAELYLLFGGALRNGGPELEQKLWEMFADRDNDPATRVSSASTLSQMTHRHVGANFLHYRYRMIEYAWEERGSDVATSLGGRLGGPRFRDPKIDVLRLDWYERERNPATRQSLMSLKDIVDRMESHYGNISGLYDQRTGSASRSSEKPARLATIRNFGSSKPRSKPSGRRSWRIGSRRSTNGSPRIASASKPRPRRTRLRSFRNGSRRNGDRTAVDLHSRLR